MNPIQKWRLENVLWSFRLKFRVTDLLLRGQVSKFSVKCGDLEATQKNGTPCNICMTTFA